jgi:hypothetical protein
VDGVADLELGLAEQLGVGLAGQQFGEAPGSGEEGAFEEVVEALGFGLLLRGQAMPGHSFTEQFLDAFPRPDRLPNFPPTCETLTLGRVSELRNRDVPLKDPHVVAPPLFSFPAA